MLYEVITDETEEIYTYIDRIGGMMTIYSESYEMGQALKSYNFV